MRYLANSISLLRNKENCSNEIISPKIALGNYLANVKFGLCYFFPEPKVPLGKDPLYLIYYSCRNGTLCSNCTKLLSFTRWSRQRAEESHYTHGPGGAASAWKRAKNYRRHLEQGIPSVISSRIKKWCIPVLGRAACWPTACLTRPARISSKHVCFCLREANTNTSYHNSQRQKKMTKTHC